MTFRFVHTADLHLDSPLKTLALRDPELGSAIANATRQAFVRLVDACLEERVDALLIAGDLYDGEIRSMAAPLFIGQQFRRLQDANIKVFIVRGNHDAEASVTKHLSLPDNVTVFSGKGECQRLEDKGVAIHGVSFPKGHVADSLLPKFRAPVEGLVNIGMLHTSLAGAPGHDLYAPCAVADLTRHGFTYWALGHVHARQVHSSAPCVVMPGMPQGRDINEAGPKSATLVSIGNDHSVTLREMPTAVAQFERLRVDVSACDSQAGLARQLRGALESARASCAADTLVARLTLVGATPLADWLRRDPDLVLNEARQAAQSMDRTLVEAVEQRTQRLETKSAAIDALSEIRAVLDEPPSVGLLKSATDIFDALRGTLPPELREKFGRSEAETQLLLADLVREGGMDLLARLASGEAA